MREATGDALASCGADGSHVQLIASPKGTWICTDAGREIASAIGASRARTLSAEIGVLQQSLITYVCDQIADGGLDVALVVGGEARFRAINAAKAGAEAPEMGGRSTSDETWRPKGQIVSQMEIDTGLFAATTQYAMIGNAFAHAHGWDDESLLASCGKVWSSNAAVAADDAFAWDKSSPSSGEITTPSADNRLVSAPYTKLLCSQMNVDQASALVFMSAAAARGQGIPSDRWVFPLAAAESNLMVPMPLRSTVHTWPAFEEAARAVIGSVEATIDDFPALEIYSCFPSAVHVQIDALSISDDRELSVCGGMTFGGGPLNNFVLQSTAAMADRLVGTSNKGLLTSISGLLTKPAVAAWSGSPVSVWRSFDVTEAARERTGTTGRATGFTGEARIVACTVDHPRKAGAGNAKAFAVLETDDGRRTVATSTGPGACDLCKGPSGVGELVRVVEEGRFEA